MVDHEVLLVLEISSQNLEHDLDRRWRVSRRLTGPRVRSRAVEQSFPLFLNRHHQAVVLTLAMDRLATSGRSEIATTHLAIGLHRERQVVIVFAAVKRVVYHDLNSLFLA